MDKQEQRILTALVKKLKTAGFKLECIRSDFDDTNELPVATIEGLVEIFEKWDMFAPTVVFTDSNGEREGVMVCEGNDKDFISDWNCGNEAFDKAVDHIAQEAYEGTYE